MSSPVILTVCGHTFEEKDLKEWLKKNSKCPLCNKTAIIENIVKNFALV